MARIRVKSPLTELDGDEMTRVIWHRIRDKLIHTVESGRMTKDLAALIRPDPPFLSTDEFPGAVDADLKRRMQ